MIAQEHARAAPLEYNALFTTFDSVFRTISKNQSEKYTLPFKTEKIDLDLVPDFPKKHKQQFLEVFGQPSLIYRDIRNLAEKLFSHPLFNDVTRLHPATVTRDGKRVYSDIYSGQWWQEFQKISKEGCVILGLMLASDKTVITGNLRNSAWPIYLKLANTPFEYRTKDTLHGTRLLAYLPVIESKRLPNKKWFPLAKKAIFHYCIGLVMAPFRKFGIFKTQGPDQKVYKCIPALTAYSADYQEHEYYENGTAELRTSSKMEHLYKLGNGLLHGTEGEKEEDEEDAEKEDKKIFMKISMHNIQNAFWKLPQPFFDLHDSLLVDDLHQLGGVYEHLLNCLDKLIMDLNGTKGASIIEEINNQASMIP
ncbi:hypothetical protein BJV82DRAFT_693418 [Fennellomyces sp. T-0311]|nr:hypothetical protein BJV82DRAFT_693418 [Fennellomyces sp. T-0311]